MKQNIIIVLVLVALALLISAVAPQFANFLVVDDEGDKTPAKGNIVGGEPMVLVHSFEPKEGNEIFGRHVVSGVIDLPTPCHFIEVERTVAESFPETVGINLNILNGSEACIQVISPTGFMEEFDAHERATISFSVNGKKKPVQFIEADNNN